MMASQIVQQFPWTWAKLFHAAPACHISSSLHLADSHQSASSATRSSQYWLFNLNMKFVCSKQSSSVTMPFPLLFEHLCRYICTNITLFIIHSIYNAAAVYRYDIGSWENKWRCIFKILILLKEFALSHECLRDQIPPQSQTDYNPINKWLLLRTSVFLYCILKKAHDTSRLWSAKTSNTLEIFLTS